MKLIELLSVLHDSVMVAIRSNETDNIVAWYDGKNSIDECYNDCEVEMVYNNGSHIEVLI